MKRRRLLSGVAAVPCSLIGLSSLAQRVPRIPDADVNALRRLLDLPAHQVDYAQAKLEMDRMVDPAADASWASQRLDEMAREIAGMLALKGMARQIPALQKIEALRAYLYQPGSWNSGLVFKYDLENDPTGKTILANKLLPNYLRYRLGNCISMPILFLILAQKLRIHCSLATAPEHLFVKFRDEAGTYHNIEATSGGGLKRDSSYQREFEITQLAIDNGIYLRALPANEGVMVMMETLLQHLSERRDWDGVHSITSLILERYPKSIQAILFKRSAYLAVLDLRYRSKYPRFTDIPADLRDNADQLVKNVRGMEVKAEALGWRWPSSEFERTNARIVRNALNNQ